MKSLWKNEFKPLAIDTPGDIVQFQCASIGTITNGKIIARIVEYSEPIKSYTKKSPFFADIDIDDLVVNIQDNLGEVSGGEFTFEFYITSVATPNYKYRIMFIQYGLSLYPVTIVLDETIAKELRLKKQQIICSDQEEFENKLTAIINSKKVGCVISSLLGLTRQDRIANV